jgi:hypothetical protein
MLSLLDIPRELWVWRCVSGLADELVFSGKVRIDDKSHGNSNYFGLTALDSLQKLKQEYIETYDDDDTVSVHVQAWLDEQIDYRPVMLGSIEPIATADLTIAKGYIYTELMNLRDMVGGYIQVDPYRKLNWYNKLADSTGQQIRYRKNLAGIKVTRDWTNFANRIYAYGVDSGGLLFDLTDAGWPTTYYDNTASQERYKERSIRRFDSDQIPDCIASGAALLQWVKEKTVELGDPKMSYDVDLLNFEERNAFDRPSLGAWMRLVDEEIDIDTNVQIIQLVTDLVTGQNVKVALASTPSSIVDFNIGDRY